MKVKRMVDLVSFSALTAAGKAINSAVKLKDKGEILEVIIPLQETLNEAQRQATEALTQIHSLTMKNIKLENRVRDLENTENWRTKYQLHTFTIGSHAWKLKETETGDYQFVCAPCFEKGNKSGLQRLGVFLTCMDCNVKIQIEKRTRATPPRVRNSF